MPAESVPRSSSAKAIHAAFRVKPQRLFAREQLVARLLHRASKRTPRQVVLYRLPDAGDADACGVGAAGDKQPLVDGKARRW